MNKYIVAFLIFGFGLSFTSLQAGNPDRQGEAGAYELLMNPWARSAGLHTLTVANISGAESMMLNVAGLSRLQKTDLTIGYTRYLEGTGIALNAIGFGQRMGKAGALGITLMTVDFGDIPITTTDQPGGTGGTFAPNFINIGLAYSYTFENKVSVGILLRGISESIADLSAFGIAIDAGVQYVTGEKDNFKFGISLRNIGSPMKFGGEGLSFNATNPTGDISYNLTFDERAEDFELPSTLNIGISYDIYAGSKHKFTLVGAFVSNSFSRDQLGGGIEYAFNDMFMLRTAYRFGIGNALQENVQNNVYSGLAAGVSVLVPTKKGASNKFGIDYAYRVTEPFSGTHNFAVRFVL
ncbi:MAG: PorV/PorQ family protein [Bacteroidota bacterium]